MRKRPLSIDFTRLPQDLKTIAALADQQMYDLRQPASSDRPEYEMLTYVHKFRLRIDDHEENRLEFRSGSKQLRFEIDGRGACQKLTAFVDFAAYLALLNGIPDWDARLLTRYALMGIKAAASKLGTLRDHASVQRELERIAECDDHALLLAATLTIAPPVLLRGLGGASGDVIDAHAMQLGMPSQWLRDLVELSRNHLDLNFPQLPDGWHQARFRCHGADCDQSIQPHHAKLPSDESPVESLK